MSSTIGEVAEQVRSKNAGPFWMTIDVFFNTDEDYERAVRSTLTDPVVIGALYATDPAVVCVYPLPELRAIKLSLPRPTAQGSIGDRDMHAGQQYVPLLSLRMPKRPEADQGETAMKPSIRTPTRNDVEGIKQIAVDSKMFDADEVGLFDEMLEGFLNGSLADHRWLVTDDAEGHAIAAAYYALEPFADRMWNLYFIAVAPKEQGRGLGGLLIEYVEHELRGRGEEVARVLVVETSSTDRYVQTREFYRNHGYSEEARIRQFYGPDDDKIVFWKSLLETSW